jgi:hypothetical protein
VPISVVLGFSAVHAPGQEFGLGVINNSSVEFASVGVLPVLMVNSSSVNKRRSVICLSCFISPSLDKGHFTTI